MSTMTGVMRRTVLWGVVGAALALGAAGVARADVASDKSGAIIIFPKIIVDSSGLLFGPGGVDTEIQITNTSNSVIAARCFLVNATSHCSNDPTKACTVEGEADPSTRRCPTGGTCDAQWSENDFRMTLTKRQPISWKASEGMVTFPCDGVTSGSCPGRQSNRGSDGSPSSIVPAQEDPFVGELKCVEVDPNDFAPSVGFDPANNLAGDLKGEATILWVDADGGGIDAGKYNAIGLQSTLTNNRDDTLLIGGDGAEYNGCPNVLIMNHMFDDATVGSHKSGGAFGFSGKVTTDLTVIPCGEDFKVQENNLGGAILQFLIFNEFEQRFSTSTGFTCWREVQLSDIDTRPGPSGNPQSIFNVGVQGTLSGQTRIRSVEGATKGNTVLAITEEFWDCTAGTGGSCTTAQNIHFTGTRAKGDQLILSPQLP